MLKILGVLLLSAGLIGLILPVIPGIIFLIPALILLFPGYSDILKGKVL